ncbi:hypothetical protein SASPL_157638 [Salvia splendens]|uniref:Nodulin homeobox N-terminal domain-containing protein n=1 Tax=Salvia splendens TaxID=180675 RepID=A0A8X8VUM3_SALSN|nr:hypothetical protein SASPL_157638 [Salvia splendens]
MNLKLSCSDNISSYMAVISCLKSKALSILMQLCEAESVSYPDDVASNTATQDMAKSAGLEAPCSKGELQALQPDMIIVFHH